MSNFNITLDKTIRTENQARSVINMSDKLDNTMHSQILKSSKLQSSRTQYQKNNQSASNSSKNTNNVRIIPYNNVIRYFYSNDLYGRRIDAYMK